MALQNVRIIVEVTPREVTLSLTDAKGSRIEHERFAVPDGGREVAPAGVGRDVFNLLYQCAQDAFHGGSDGMQGDA